MSLVVCPESHAAKAGADVLVAGGNAMDAAIGAAWVQGVTNHLLCGIGGSLSIYHHDGRTGARTVLNAEVESGSGEVPSNWAADFDHRVEASLRYRLRSRDNEVGYRAIMVPGFVRGCWVAYQRFGSGRLAWSRLLAPAIHLAREGFEVTPYGAEFSHMIVQRELMDAKDGRTPRWDVTDGARPLMLRHDGRPYEQGDRFVQPDLARTLQQIADAGGDDFYEGDLAAQMAVDLAAHGSLVTAGDLREFSIWADEPIRGVFRGFELAAQPYSNGAQIIEVLQILDGFDVRALGHNSAEYIALVAKAMRAAAADYGPMKGRSREGMAADEMAMISPERAAEWAERIGEGASVAVKTVAADRGTTHLNAIDDDGNVVSLNHSIGSAGSGVVSPGLGFLYNGDMGIFDPRPGQANSVGPKKRQQGGSPLAMYREGRPYMVLGAPGGTRILTSIVQVVLNVIDFGHDLRTAVTLPRFHSQDGTTIYLEPSVPEATAVALRRSGHDVIRSRYAARPQAIAIIDGNVQGGSDPRGQTSVDFGEVPPYDWSADPTLR